MSTWFITGCSSGFGRVLAQTCIERGFNTVVTARRLCDIDDIAGENVLKLPLDVTDHDQVVAAVEAATERFTDIDVLVNNAGYCYRSPVEEGDRNAVEKMFAVNFYGVLDVIQQVMPQMRVRQSGTIVNISSVAGRLAPPSSGFYAASKFALEGISDALRVETEGFGIRVILIEPGAFRTNFNYRAFAESVVETDVYADSVGKRRKEVINMCGKEPGDPTKAAEAIIAVATAKNPPFRLPLGESAYSRIRALLATQTAELDAWESIGRHTDYQE